MANPSNDEGSLTKRPVDRGPSKALEVQSFKLKSTMLSFLRIGNYQIRSQNNPHLTAKWYYTSKQLKWEILENGLKKKIEIDWSNISAMRVGYGGDPEILEIELYRRPRFYSEAEVRPRKSFSWQACSDFTDGQASASRIHYLEFPRGMLKRRMEPLFILDNYLRDSIERPFPILDSPFFIGCSAGARQAPPPPTPLISSQSLPHHQIPAGHSIVPTWSSNSNVMDSTSTGPQSSNYGYPQPSPSLPRSGMIPDQDLSMGHSAQNATASSYNPNNTRHGPEGSHQVDVDHQSALTSSLNCDLDLTLGPPSSSSFYRSDDDKNEC